MNIISRIDGLLIEIQSKEEKIINVTDSLIRDINDLESEGLIKLEQLDNNKYKAKLSLKGAMFIEEGGYKNIFHKREKERRHNLTILICYILTALGGMTTALIAIFK